MSSKGGRNQRNLAKLMSTWTGWTFHSTPRSGGLHWAKDNRVTGDLVCEAEHADEFPFSVETKVRKKKKSNAVKIDIGNLLTVGLDGFIGDAWRQSCEDADRINKLPMACLKNDGMAKVTYYLFLPKIVGMAIYKELPISKKYNYLMANKKIDLFISTTDWLFACDSEKVFKIVKRFL